MARGQGSWSILRLLRTLLSVFRRDGPISMWTLFGSYFKPSGPSIIGCGPRMSEPESLRVGDTCSVTSQPEVTIPNQKSRSLVDRQQGLKLSHKDGLLESEN